MRPQAVVRCQGTADVVATMAFAARFPLPIAVRSGGHDFAGGSSTTGVVVDVSGLDAVTLTDDVATIGAGATLGRVYTELDAHGRTISGGCGQTVGIAGLTLGGGLGILGRSHGLTCDRLTEAEVVLADGRVVTGDAHQDPELLWALRGGGGARLGVVTRLGFDTVPAPRCAAFTLTWPADHAAAVVDAWQAWAPDAPEPMAASLLVTVPAGLARPPQVTVMGAAHSTSRAAAEALLDQLVARAGADPATVSCEELPWLGAKRYLNEHGPEGEPGHLFMRSEFFDRSLPSDVVAALVAELVTTRVAGEARELDFTPLGGAYRRAAPEATAFPHRSARFLLKPAAIVPAGGTPSPWLERTWRTAGAHGTGGAYPNFPDPELADPGRAYYADNLERLRRAKVTYDPGDRLGRGLLTARP